jgi:hypothetical protein
MSQRDPESLLPLTPGMFQVLIALADGEKHGYAVIKEVSRRTEPRRSTRSSGASCRKA